jgi:antitoxin CptB
MTLNKEDLKNKIIYRASYRGTKEMDILMTAFVKSLINDLDENFLKTLDSFVDMDDETLISIKKKESLINYKDEKILLIIDKFQKFK